MWASIFGEINFFQNFNFSFSNTQSDIILHLTHWQYWFWFWFTYFLVLYYLLFLKLIKSRGIFQKPRLATSLKSHGKWGDILVCFVPIGWCTNILTNSNFILRMMEWQSESVNFTLRVRGKQWYWVYKFDVQDYKMLLNSTKSLGKNIWFNSTYAWNFNFLLLLRDLTSMEKNYFIWNKSVWDICEAKFGGIQSSRSFYNTGTYSDDNVYLEYALGTWLSDSKSFTKPYFTFLNSSIFTPVSFLMGSDYNSVYRVNEQPGFSFNTTTLSDNFYFDTFHNNAVAVDPLVSSITNKSIFDSDSATTNPANVVNIDTPNSEVSSTPTDAINSDQSHINGLVSDLNRTSFAKVLNEAMYYKKIKPILMDFNKLRSFTSTFSSIDHITRVGKDINFYKPLKLVNFNFNLTLSYFIPLLNKQKFQPVSMFLIVKQKRVEMNRYFIVNYIMDNVNDVMLKSPDSQATHFTLNSLKNYDYSLTSLVNRRLLRTKRILVLPANTNINIITNSFDVIHSWFIPGLGVKLDCVPGRSTHHYLNIDHVGFYYGQCAEICGRFHHHMPIRICALPYEHFILWWYNYGAPYFFADPKYRVKVRKPLSRLINF